MRLLFSVLGAAGVFGSFSIFRSNKIAVGGFNTLQHFPQTRYYQGLTRMYEKLTKK